ncbi:aquaporin family protein [Paenibacillus sp. GSMTC-2017]|uniref:MIP/aquaporin family protein n=1 Tax=Paenibacillus sp. GSMTC-2017 TaxID=2794350 RepID=UPI0018D5F114|nr:MIP/aquaporin family protein [Paenibacillus sp. GSMTC-2017]MBH5319558.1 aquaporin family protein [Paenibacillus sp. GSMTC-2017]
MSPFIAEIVGTAMLILLGNGVVAGVLLKKSKAENSGWIVITLAWGLAVAVSAYAVGGFSGAHLNPALTIGLAVAGQFEWNQVATYITGQMIGAILGSVLVWLHYLPHWKATEDKDLKLAVFATAPAIRSVGANLMSEIIGTFVLVLGIMAIGANTVADGLGPLIVGALIVVIGLSLGGTTGYAINPARDLGPRIAHFLLPIHGKGSSDWGYAFVPVVGPIIGGILAALFYTNVFGV